MNKSNQFNSGNKAHT